MTDKNAPDEPLENNEPTQRRLSDKIALAHGLAINEGKKNVADFLIKALELDLSGIGGAMVDEKRKSLSELEDIFNRHDAFSADKNRRTKNSD